MSDPLTVPTANWIALYTKAGTAIQNNTAFLALPSPTQAQAVAQVQALTRQTNAIIRMLLGMLDTTDGT